MRFRIGHGGLLARVKITAKLQHPLHLCPRPLLGEGNPALRKPFLYALRSPSITLPLLPRFSPGRERRVHEHELLF